MAESTRVASYIDGNTITGAEVNQIQDAAIQSRFVSRPWLASSGGTNLVVGATDGAVIDAVKLPAKAETTVSVGSLSTDLWYYVYAYNDSGVITYEVSQTAPDAYNRFKSGDTTRLYVGFFRTFTDSTVKIVAFRSHNGRYLYRISQNFSAGLQTQLALITNGVAGAAADVNGTKAFPPHCRLGIVRFTVERVSGTTGESTSLYTKSDTTVPQYLLSLPGTLQTAGETLSQVVEIELSSTQRFDYLVSDGTKVKTNILAMGAVEQLP